MSFATIALALTLGGGGVDEISVEVHADAPLPTRRDDELRVHALPVGSGSCFLLECPVRSDGVRDLPIIVDCGSSARGREDLYRREAAEYIDARIPDHTANVILTHPHRDHFNILGRLIRGRHDLAELQTPRFIIGDRRGKYRRWARRHWRRNGLEVAIEGGPEPIGDRMPCGPAQVRVLAANTRGQAKQIPNLRGLIVSVDYDGTRLIFGGDAVGKSQRVAEATLEAVGGPDPRFTIMFAPHHGSSTQDSNDITWADATRPDLVLFSAGPWYGHPRCRSVENYGHTREVEEHAFGCYRRGSLFGCTRGPASHARTRHGWFNTQASHGVVLTVSDDRVQVHTGLR